MDLHAQLLLRDKSLADSARESVQHIRTEARSLLRLVLNLLDISKSEEGRLEPRSVELELEPLFGEILEAFELRARTSGLSLVQSLSTKTAFADPDLLRRVVENLLDNAIRHAPEGSAVELHSQRVNGDLEIRVSDAGSGIAPEMRERVFEKFIQVESGELPAARSGRGLGLTFCKLAVEAHGGRIWVEDANPGATFCIRIPHER